MIKASLCITVCYTYSKQQVMQQEKAGDNSPLQPVKKTQ